MKRTTIRVLAASMVSALAAFVAPTASAEQVGFMNAVCQIGHGRAQLSVKYTVYADAPVWQDNMGRYQGNSQVGNIVYWEGQLNTVYGNYRIEGRNGILEAHPHHGHYSDMIILYVEQTGQTSFNLRDEQNVRHPCQIA